MFYVSSQLSLVRLKHTIGYFALCCYEPIKKLTLASEKMSFWIPQQWLFLKVLFFCGEKNARIPCKILQEYELKWSSKSDYLQMITFNSEYTSWPLEFFCSRHHLYFRLPFLTSGKPYDSPCKTNSGPFIPWTIDTKSLTAQGISKLMLERWRSEPTKLR